MIDPVKAFDSILRYVSPEAMRRSDMGFLIVAVREELAAPKAGTTSTAALEAEVATLKEKLAATQMLLEIETAPHITSSVLPPLESLPAPKKGRKKVSENN